MIDHAKLPLGKKPFVPDHRDLALANYIDAGRILDSVAIPASFNWARWNAPNGAPIPRDTNPLGNDLYGNCVFVMIAHKLRRIGAIVGDLQLMNITAEDVIKTYFDATGGNDWGFVIRDALKMLVNTGLFGVKADAFVAVNFKDPVERRIAGFLGCGTCNGYALPLTAQGQVDDQGRQLWFKPTGGWPEGKGPGSWGGHAIDKCGERMNKGISWGGDATWNDDFEIECCDESWLVLVPQWGNAMRCPNGFAYADLLADVRARQRQGA